MKDKTCSVNESDFFSLEEITEIKLEELISFNVKNLELYSR